jgi:hypothetical protein
MSFPFAGWLKTILLTHRRWRRHKPRTAVRRACPTRLSVELLESRLVPSTLIDNATVTVLPSSTAAYAGYAQVSSLDTGADQYVTDYASSGQGANTHLDYQFPVPETFSEIIYTNRTTSGGPNGGFVGGTYDYVYKYEYIFSNDPNFATNVGIVTIDLPNPGITVLNTVADFQSQTAIPDITAQYVRWQVLACNGNNPGAADFEFYTGRPPTVAADLAAVSANEGSTASNTGSFQDVNGNSTVTLSASVGTVTQNNTNGTWSWSLNVADGPPGSFPVTITATDNQGTAVQTTFTCAVNFVPPTISLSGSATVNEGSPYTLNLGTVTDPAQDTITGYTINWGDGVIDPFTGSPANTTATHTYNDGPASQTPSVTVTDDDGSFVAGSLGVNVLNVAPTATLSTNSGITYGTAATASFSNPFDPSGADAAAGFHYAFSIDTDTTGSATYANSGTSNSASFGILPAGPHTVYARIIDEDGNFTPYTSNLTVVPAGSTVTVSLTDAAPIVYDGNPHCATAGWISTGSDGEGGSLAVSYVGIDGTVYPSSTTAPTNAGEYQASASYPGDNNHTGNSSVAIFTINKAPLNVTVTSDLMLANQGLVSPPPLGGTANGVAFTGSTTFTTAQGDTLTVTLGSAVTATSLVGVYPIIATVTGAAQANYAQPASGNMYVVTVGPNAGIGACKVSFWANKGNAKLITAADLIALDQLYLVNNKRASDFDPATADQLQRWFRSDSNSLAKALSIQLAVMDLNVLSGNVNAADVVYAGNLLPVVGSSFAVTGLDGGGFITVGNLMTLANNALAQYTSPAKRDNHGNGVGKYLDALEDALKAANKNTSFVQQVVPAGS